MAKASLRREFVFENFRLYAVTDLKSDDPAILKSIDRAYQGGADIVQLRSKILPDAALYAIGLKIRKIADRRGKLFFVNDRIDVALAVFADGLHVGQDDLPVAVIRKLCRHCGRKLWIGKSTHSLAQARAAEREGVDYIGVGPIFPTPTKGQYKPVGLDLITQVRRQIRLPFVVIGGIDRSNIHQVLNAGAVRVAVVRALFSAEDSKHAAEELRRVIEGYTK